MCNFSHLNAIRVSKLVKGTNSEPDSCVELRICQELSHSKLTRVDSHCFPCRQPQLPAGTGDSMVRIAEEKFRVRVRVLPPGEVVEKGLRVGRGEQRHNFQLT